MDLLYRGAQLNPLSADIRFRLSGYLLSMQETDEGLIYFKQALEVDPNRSEHFFDLFPQFADHPRVMAMMDQHSRQRKR
jgi:tetratricopeptide (TPR) repeat protein